MKFLHHCLFSLGLCLLTQNLFAQSLLPNFSIYQAATKKKQAFFSYLLPLANKANHRIIQDKQHLLHLQKQVAILNNKDKQWLQKMAVRYRIKSTRPIDIIQQLLPKIDIIPSSLLLAQAANESAWGTSRFAKQGNNLFGQWCYKPNCGITPLKRSKGLTYEVQKFQTPFDSIYAYALNLNCHPSYQKLRDIRLKLRQAGKTVNGLNLAQGLNKYSERGIAYVHDIQAMIKTNHLE